MSVVLSKKIDYLVSADFEAHPELSLQEKTRLVIEEYQEELRTYHEKEGIFTFLYLIIINKSFLSIFYKLFFYRSIHIFKERHQSIIFHIRKGKISNRRISRGTKNLP